MYQDDGKAVNLWASFVQGNDQAFRGVYELYFDDLLHYGYCFCKDKGLVEDAIQDVFVTIHQKRKALGGVVNSKAYLFTCLRRRIVSIKTKLPELEDALDATNSHHQKALNIEDHLILSEEEQQLFELLSCQLNALSDKQREIIYLYFIQDLSYTEISDLLQISVSSARTALYRSIKTLKENLDLPDTNYEKSIDMKALKKVLHVIAPLIMLLPNA